MASDSLSNTDTSSNVSPDQSPISNADHTPAVLKDPRALVQEDIDRRFTYHPPKGDQPQRYQQLRGRGKQLAEEIVGLTPASREQSLALTKLEEALFFANAAIARNE